MRHFLPPPTRALIFSVVLPGVKAPSVMRALAESAGENSFVEMHGQVALDSQIYAWALGSLPHIRVIQGNAPQSCLRQLGLFCRLVGITVIGNPVWRAIDSYRHIRHVSDHPLHELANLPGMSIGRFFEHEGSGPVRNRQTRALAQGKEQAEPDGEGLLRLALSRLETEFRWIGLEEMLADQNESFADLLAAHGLARPSSPLVSNHPPRETISRAEASAIREANALDVALHGRFARPSASAGPRSSKGRPGD